MAKNIVELMKQEIINRSNKFEQETKGTKDEYNLYREHVQYVYKYVCLLSKDKDVDHEVLKLSALLHDIARDMDDKIQLDLMNKRLFLEVVQ